MSLLVSMLSKFPIAFLPRSKHLLISWLQSPSVVTLEPKKIKSLTVFIVSPTICHEVVGPDAMIFECWVLSQVFHSLLSPSPRGSLVPLHFLTLVLYLLHIWACWYFSLQSWFQLVIHPAWPFTWCTPHKWRRKWQPSPVSLPGKSHGQRSLPGGLESMGLQRIGHDWATNTYLLTLTLHIS